MTFKQNFTQILKTIVKHLNEDYCKASEKATENCNYSLYCQHLKLISSVC